jgi:TM2 domain-containing membrane protein YozV
MAASTSQPQQGPAQTYVPPTEETHSTAMGYVLWVLLFVSGSYRFYYGKPLTGIIWFLTAGVLLIGWIVDLFLIPGMKRQADLRYRAGYLSYNVAWILFFLLGALGVHRFYMGKWGTGIIWLLTFGVFGFGVLYDLLTLNGQVNELNILGPRS